MFMNVYSELFKVLSEYFLSEYFVFNLAYCSYNFIVRNILHGYNVYIVFY